MESKLPVVCVGGIIVHDILDINFVCADSKDSYLTRKYMANIQHTYIYMHPYAHTHIIAYRGFQVACQNEKCQVQNPLTLNFC